MAAIRELLLEVTQSYQHPDPQEQCGKNQEIQPNVKIAWEDKHTLAFWNVWTVIISDS